MFSPETIQQLKDGIRKGTPSRGPVDVQILPVDYCNAKCVFCPLFAVPPDIKKKHAPGFLVKKNKLDMGLFYRLIDDLEVMGGIKRLQFTGGEPLLHPQLASMVSYLEDKMPYCEVAIVTNGINLIKVLKDLTVAGVDRFSLSINGASAESLRRLGMGGKATFNKIIIALKKLRELRSLTGRPLLGLTSVLTRYNYNEIEDLVNLALEFRVNSLTFIPLAMYESGDYRSNEKLTLSREEFSRFNTELKKAKEKVQKQGLFLGLSSRWDERGILSIGDLYQKISCYTGYTFTMIWPDGKVCPCCSCEGVMGDLNQKSFTDIWVSEKYNDFRKKALNVKTLSNLDQCHCKDCGYIHENEKYHHLLNQ